MKLYSGITSFIQQSGNIMRFILAMIITVTLVGVSGCAEHIKPPPEPDWRHTIDLDAKRSEINQAVFRE